MIYTRKSIEWIIDRLRSDQSSDGSWNYPFETGISTDAYTIILLKTLEIDEEELIKGLAARIISRQEKNGAWKIFYDEDKGNLTETFGYLFLKLLAKLKHRTLNNRANY